MLCESCSNWVDCTRADKKPDGFCLLRDLFTHTSEKKCNDYKKGNPITEKEWEDFQYADA